MRGRRHTDVVLADMALRWIDKLGGTDVYTPANAYQLVESLRIDYGQLGPFGIRPTR